MSILEQGVSDGVASRRPRHGEKQFTFDVFDTSICRLLHVPEHIHLIVGRKLRHLGVTTLSDAVWMYARATAEFQQRQTVAHNEVTLSGIYERLQYLLGLTDRVRDLAIEIELSEESRLIRGIASTQERVSSLRSGKYPPIFISDTYFTSAQVKGFLIGAGYSAPVDVVASCQRGKSKIHGDIFDEVAAEKGLASGKFHHLGDHSISDLEMPRLRGWNAELFTDSYYTARERVMFAAINGEFLSSAIAGSARAARLGQSRPVAPGILTASASVVGPLFAAYVLWILLDASARGARTIHFLGRDGQVLVPICKRLAGWLGLEIEARYTFASRRAFLLSSLEQDERTIVEQALKSAYYDQITLSDALISLQYTTLECDRIASVSGVALTAVASEMDADRARALHEALSQPELKAALLSRARSARAATMAYLESEGMFAGREAVIVDLGWRGTTQLRLQKTVGSRVEFVGYYLGLNSKVLPADAKTRIWNAKARWKTSLLEVMASADHTSVEGFGFDVNGAPTCSPPVGEDYPSTTWGSREQQQIAVRFVDYFTRAVELEYFEKQDVYEALRRSALAAYDHFRLAPTKEEARAYGGMAHQNGVVHNNARELAGVVSSKDVLRHVFDRKAKAGVTSWYMGSIARSHAHSLPRLIHGSIHEAIVFGARIRSKLRKIEYGRSARRSLRSLRPETRGQA